MEIGRQDGWISVKNRMPADNERQVLIWVKSYFQGKGGPSVALRMDGKWHAFQAWDIYDKDVDFWMELPDGPNLEEV